MNIAILADNLTFGGVNRYCLDLFKGLQTFPDVQVSLLALPDHSDGWLRQETDARGVPLHVLPMRSVFDPQVIRHLRQWIIDHHVDVLHTQDYRANIIARLAVRGGRLPTRLVCTMHGAHYFPAATARLRLYFTLNYLTMFLSDRIIAVSEETRKPLTPWGVRGKTQVIHNGTPIPSPVDLAHRLANRQALDIPPHAKVILFVGRLAHQKNPEALINVTRQTLSARADAVFLVVGDGPFLPAMQDQLQDLSPRVRFLGFQRDVTPFYTAADVLFLPSRYEGLPMTLIEAFARGVPAVASTVGGIPEVVVDGVNGFLCDPLDFEQMGERLLQLLDDDALRKCFGDQAHRTAEESFSLDQMCRETYDLYRQCGQGLRSGAERP